MQISLFLDRFHVQLAARAQLHPLDDFGSWVELTHAAALTAGAAIHALAPLCGATGAMPIERSAAALETLRSTCTRLDLSPQAVVASCESAFADVCSILRASCDIGSL